MKKVLNKEQIEEIGLEAIHSFTEGGNTVVTNKDGAKALSEMEEEKRKAEFLKEFMVKLKQIKPRKKPHQKYSSNLIPSPKRNRTKKTKY